MPASRRLRDHGLSLVLGACFLLLLGAQTFTGWHVYNASQEDHGHPPIPLGGYLTTGHFGEAVFENWESEFLQMAAYIMLTVFLYQRGSSESKDPDKPGAQDEDPALHRDDPEAPGPVRRGGWRLRLYRRSLSLTFGALFLLSFTGHAYAGHVEANAERAEHHQPPESVAAYVAGSQFWFESFQNWQSEFLAVLSIVVLSIHLREHGSPESKPVHAPHHQTGG